MLEVYSLKHPQALLFKHITASDAMRFGDRMHRTDWCDAREYLQVATITTGPAQHSFVPHIHITNERRVTCTQETWIVVTGRAEVRLFDVDGTHLSDVTLETCDCLITLGGGHEYRVEPHTLIWEHKNGPYLGRDADKREIGNAAGL